MTARIIATLLAAIVYWYVVSHFAGVIEPWDAPRFWLLWYPVALLLSGAAGFALGRKGWLAGLLIVVAQIPVMWLNGGAHEGALWAVGAVALGILAVPAMVIATLAGWINARRTHSR